MKVDAAGLVAAAQRVAAAVEGVAGGDAAHPPLAADQASLGAAGRLSGTGAELAAAIAAHAAALVASVEHLAAVASGFVAQDEKNAATIAALSSAPKGPTLTGWAPPAPPIPPDVRTPFPAPVAAPPEAIAAATHSGDPGAGEPFVAAWSRVCGAATDAAAVIRSAITDLPESLDGPVSTPAVSAHLRKFATGFETFGARARILAQQAAEHAAQQAQARQDIPHPQQLAHAKRRVETIALANAQSGGIYAAPLAQATADLTALNEQTAQGYTAYHMATDATTAGEVDDPASGASGADDPGAGDITTADGQPGTPTGTDPVSPETTGKIAGMLPEMIPAVLGAAGGLVGGLLGAAAKAPQSLAQAATQGLSGLTPPNTGDPSGGGGEPFEPERQGSEPDNLGADDGGEGETIPAAGGSTTPPLSVAPSTGAAPTPPILPTGATPPPPQPAGGGGGMMPMAMPMGGMRGRGGAGNDGPRRTKHVVVPPIPHTEEVTGKVSADRLAVSSTAPRNSDTGFPRDDPPASPPGPIVRRVVSRPPEDAS